MTTESPDHHTLRSGDRSGWTQAICESCWIDAHTTTVEGDLQVRSPVLVAHKQVEFCCYCDQPTIWGCYVRVDPATVPFPTHSPRQESHR